MTRVPGRARRRRPRQHRTDHRTSAALIAVLSVAAMHRARAQSPVSGVVYDSLAGRPLAGATVQLLPAGELRADGFVAVSDSAGRYRFVTVPAGRYVIGFLHPRLDSLGLTASVRALRVTAGGDSVEVPELAVPAAKALLAAYCGPAQGNSADSTGALVGQVWDADVGAPAPGATVEVRWGELVFDARGGRREVRTVRATTGPEGRYVACGVPTGAPVAVRADAPARPDDPARAARASGTVEIALPPDTAVVIQDAWVVAASDLSGPDGVAGAARAGATLAGVVRRPDGSPLSGARVVLRHAAMAWAAITGANGRFRLDDLPAGTREVETLAIGFAPLTTAVHLRPGRAATLDATFVMRVARLDEARVYGRRSRAAQEFEQRLRTRLGYFYTGADFTRLGLRDVGDAVLRTPGARVLSTSPGRQAMGLPARGQLCNPYPMIYVDGFPLIEGAVPPAGATSNGPLDRPPVATTADVQSAIPTNNISAVEIYEMTQAPGQYPAQGRCGVVLVWSRGAA